MKRTFRNLNSFIKNKQFDERFMKPTHLNLSSDFKFMKESVDKFLKINKSSLYSEIAGKNGTNPYPFIISQRELSEQRKIQEAVYFTMKSIVTNYNFDSRIRETYDFSDQVKEIIKLCDDKPYDYVGSYRPDFLYEHETLNVKLCEINARFCLNAYFLTYFGYNLINECPEMMDAVEKDPNLKRLQIECIKEINKVGTIFENVFDTRKPIGILKNKEVSAFKKINEYIKNKYIEFKHGNDLFFFNQKYKNTLILNPSDLCLNSNSKKLTFKNQTELDQFILELHQDEILALPKDILKAIVKSSKYINDLRTIFICHDKRLLTILSRDDILSDYLSSYYHEIVRKHRILSILPKFCADKIKEDVLTTKNEWLLKPCLLGKGKGIIFGKDLNHDEWSKLIENILTENKNEFILQQYIKQEKFSYFENQEKFQNIVGTLLCFNDTFLGPGIYRTSQSELIALTRNGCLMFPVKKGINESIFSKLPLKIKKNPSKLSLVAPKCFIEEKPKFKNHKPLKLPKSSIFYLEKKSFKDIQYYEESLIENGIALISMSFNDQSSSFMLDLVKQLGIAQSHSSNGNDYLWDIKVSNKTEARSHANSEFSMHTDASFEKNSNIPRFFGLHVLYNDRYKGGQSLFIKIDDLLSCLTENEIHLLCDRKLEFKIPNEFYKDPLIHSNIGSILSFDKLNNGICRFRKDIIMNQSALDVKFKAVLDKFESLIDIQKSNLIKYCQLKSNTVVFVDNCRYLHGRTEINDPKRHLRRVRFQTNHEQLLPIF